MTRYEVCKPSLITYFHTENGRQHLKEAQKRYRETEMGQQKNRELRMKCYYKAKLWKDEIKRLNAIEF